MALYYKWDVKNGFAFVLEFFSLISDGLGGVRDIAPHRCPQFGQITENPLKNKKFGKLNAHKISEDFLLSLIPPKTNIFFFQFLPYHLKSG
jgi:hypothetical protein